MSVTSQQLLQELATSLSHHELKPKTYTNLTGLPLDKRHTEGHRRTVSGSNSNGLVRALSLGYFGDSGGEREGEAGSRLAVTLDITQLGFINQEVHELTSQQLKRFEVALSNFKLSHPDGIPKDSSLWKLTGLTNYLPDLFNKPLPPLSCLKLIFVHAASTPVLRLGQFDPRDIINLQGMSLNFTQPIPLHLFRNLTHLELYWIVPERVSDWDQFSTKLKTLTCKKGLAHSDQLFIDVFPTPPDETSPPWPHLATIDLSDNSLTELTERTCQAITQCETLSLAENKLTTVPKYLKELYMLHTLNLAKNQLHSVLNLDHTLGNVHSLDLSYNSLTSLTGLHKLWALEWLDVAYNSLTELEEFNKLATLPSLTNINVKGNPVCNKADYRRYLFSSLSHPDKWFTLDGTPPKSFETPETLKVDMVDIEVPSSKLVSSQLKSTKKSKPSRKLSKRVATIRSTTSDWVDDDHSSGTSSLINPSLEPHSQFTEESAELPTEGSSHPVRRAIRFADLEDRQLEKGTPSPQLPTRTQSHLTRTPLDSPLLSPPESFTTASPISNGDLFRKRVEAMRNEAGTTWLKVFREVQNQKKPTDPTTNPITPVPKELDFDTPKFEYLQSKSLEPDIEPDSTSPPSPSSPSTKSLEPREVEVTESDPVVETNSEVVADPLPDGPRFEMLVDEISLDSTPDRIVKASSGVPSTWILSDSELVIVDPTTLTIVSSKPYVSLMKVVLPSRPRSVRLEFKPSRYDKPGVYDVTLESMDSYRTFLNSLKPILKRNVDDGLIHDRYKQAKCLTCSWQGFLSDGSSFLTQQEVTPLSMQDTDGTTFLNMGLNLHLFSFAGHGASKDYSNSLICPKCDSTFLVEFYGQEKSDPAGILPSLVNFPSQATKFMNSYIGSPITSHMMGSFLKQTGHGPVNGDTNRHSTLGPSSGVTPHPESDLDWCNDLPGFQPTLLPFLTPTNALRLHIDLRLLEGEGETFAAWMPTTHFSQAPPMFTVPSKWSLRAYASHGDMLPRPPVEEPLYILLSTQYLYLLGLNVQDMNEPETALLLRHRIAFTSIARIDVGCNRQSLIFHFNICDKDPKSHQYQLKPSPDRLSSSITVLIRDKTTCSKFLDSLLVLLYELGIKIVNHNVLWAVQNLRAQVFLQPGTKDYRVNGQLLPGDQLPRDPATGKDVVVDKVTFDFLKFAGQVGFYHDGYLQSVVVVATDTYLYLCYDRSDVWPPAVSDLAELCHYEEPPRTAHRLTCRAIPQYTPIEALALKDIMSVQNRPMEISCRFGPPGAQATTPVVSFKVALTITGLPPPPPPPHLIPLPPSRPATPPHDPSTPITTALPPPPVAPPSGAQWHLLFTTDTSAQELLEVLHYSD